MFRELTVLSDFAVKLRAGGEYGSSSAIESAVTEAVLGAPASGVVRGLVMAAMLACTAPS